MEKELMLECVGKKEFIDRVNYAISGQHRIAVTKVEYQLFEKEEEGWTQEYLVVTYSGGAIAARNINMNSNSANFEEIAKLINGGYYSEVKDYRKISSEWKRIL